MHSIHQEKYEFIGKFFNDCKKYDENDTVLILRLNIYDPYTYILGLMEVKKHMSGLR